MESSRFFEELPKDYSEEQDTLKLSTIKTHHRSGALVQERVEEADTAKLTSISTQDILERPSEREMTRMPPVSSSTNMVARRIVPDMPHIATISTSSPTTPGTDSLQEGLHGEGEASTLGDIADRETMFALPITPFPEVAEPGIGRTGEDGREVLQTSLNCLHRSPNAAGVAPTGPQALFLMALLSIFVIHALTMGSGQFLGSQGWAYVLGGAASTNNSDILTTVNQQIQQNTHPTPGATAKVQITPQQYIDLIVQKMTLDQKLGQMMIVQFVGSSYSLDLSAMISQYNVGAVLIFAANGNIVSKAQLKGLIAQMQGSSPLHMIVAIDQEGGTVDRLQALDGPRPAAATIGATNDPQKALAEGQQDARDLTSYGINLNLAPVVDVTNVYNVQLAGRTFGDNPTLVTKMAAAYLQGLQQSGKVLGTLKHFPGLGDVAGDPHITVPNLYRSQSGLESIDWAPYRTLIAQGAVHAIMVTHEIVHAIDDTKPSSLSYKVVTGILRDQLGFQGVILTDSLTMEGITAYYSEGEAAALAIEAGSDLLMGASTPDGVAAMFDGIKQAMSTGAITQQRIDDSVRRILMLKYQMGLFTIPTN